MEHKIHINLTENGYAELIVLKNKLGLKDIPDLIRSSLVLMNFIEQEKKKGSKLCLIKDGVSTEIIKLT